MKLFIGKSTHVIDAKGRVNIPSSFRKQLDDQVVLTLPITLETPIIMTPEDYSERFEELSRLSKADVNIVTYFRRMEKYTVICNIDSHGRIVIPQEVREKFSLNIGEEIHVFGHANTIELWNVDRYDNNIGDIEMVDGKIVYSDEDKEALNKIIESGI